MVMGVAVGKILHGSQSFKYHAPIYAGDRITERLVIAAGPNNPVGTTWIDLSEDTYGIHGTPEPGHISRTQSSGCVRLTNFAAEAVASAVKAGTPVTFQE